MQKFGGGGGGGGGGGVSGGGLVGEKKVYHGICASG